MTTSSYADDPTGRWNLWREHLSRRPGASTRSPRRMPTPAGRCGSSGTRWFGRLEDGRIVAVRTNGDDELVLIDPDGTVDPACGDPPPPRSCVEDVAGHARARRPARRRTRRARCGSSISSDPEAAELIRGGPAQWATRMDAAPRAVTFDGPTRTGARVRLPADEPAGTRRLRASGRRISSTSTAARPRTVGGAASGADRRTSRAAGIGVLDVNYGGSSGYGRAYRERLRGQWGIVDVEDVAAAASGLAAPGPADAARLAIAGGSAGGWTVLGALVGIGRVRRRHLPLRRRRCSRAWPPTRTTSRRATSTAWSARCPTPRSCTSSGRRCRTSERFRVPLLLLQGARRPGRAARAVRGDPRRARAHGIPHAYLRLRGRGPRLPARRERRRRAREPSWRSSAQVLRLRHARVPR